MLNKYLCIGLFFCHFFALAQQDAWVYLTDKENVAAAIATPITILTQKAIDRKSNHGVAIDSRDVPVNESYISQLKNATGITVLAKSKWFNAVHVRGTQTNINNLSGLSFVDHLDFADKSLNVRTITEPKMDKFEAETTLTNFVYGNTANQVEMINVDDLHVGDYTGTGMTIAVIDAGFTNVNTMAGFQRLRDAGHLLDGYDFVDRTSNIYAYTGNSHGTNVLSTMAGYVQNQYVGTAPDASYYLFRSEDAASENPVEESYWVEAAERADSLGVDVINTSLGYIDFDNSNYDYATTDLNGNTAYITKGANIAFDKGMLVVTSSGNSGISGVAAPADAAGVLTVGAVDANGTYASFSSRGSAIQPTQKPDVVARGSGSYILSSSNAIVQSNGTSFSSPIMAGGVTCLWQALPNKTNAEIMQIVRESASQFATPDYLLGFGIPNLQLALDNVLSTGSNSQMTFKLFPNPVDNILHIDIPEDIEEAIITIYNVLGKKVVSSVVSRGANTVNLEQLPSGVYLAKLEGEDQRINTFKLIKH